jgi:hypothetical protein
MRYSTPLRGDWSCYFEAPGGFILKSPVAIGGTNLLNVGYCTNAIDAVV